MTARDLAWKMLMRINEDGEYAHKVLLALDDSELNTKNRALVTKIVHGTLERRLTIDWILERRTQKPISRMKPGIRNLMRMSVYQILFLDQIPASAVCNEAVKMAKKIGFFGLSGFVNGVLRNIVRDVEAAGSGQKYLSVMEEGMTETEKVCFHYSMPAELCAYYLNYYPNEARDMFGAFLKDSSIAIRHNKSRCTAETLLASLEAEEVPYEKGLLPNTFRLGKAGNPSRLSAYQKGLFSIQDESSALSGNILPLRKDMCVLDLCAAPGGKTIHVADELRALGGGTVKARDISEQKIRRIKEHVKLLELDNVTCEVSDATQYDKASDKAYDLVIADLPCSGLGVIGRKPDIKYKTGTDEVEILAELQRRILKLAISYVKPGGFLCYSTCTITKEENDANVDFLISEGLKPYDFSEQVPVNLQKRYHDGRLQLFPQDGTDGFFISLLVKEADE